MKLEKLINYVGNLPFFDTHLLVQLSGEPKSQTLVQLHQWNQSGQIIRLRRGLYVLAEHYRKKTLSILQIANESYRPSYISEPLALSYYGLIPEKVVLITSTTTRVTRKFQNPFGFFTYSNIKETYYWGFVSEKIEETPVWIAEPEKALLDYFHFNQGEWTKERLEEMRFQNLDGIDFIKLNAYAQKWDSPRLKRAAANLSIQASHE